MVDDPADGGAPADACSDISPARLEAFSDGILAITATLLVLEVRPPVSSASVWPTLEHELPALVTYAVSFLIVGTAWVHHHNLFQEVRSVDRTLLFLNLGLLITTGFLPIPTATLGSHLGGEYAVAAAVFYALAASVGTAWFTLLWTHLNARPHLVRPASRARTASARRRSLVGPVSFGISALLALLTPTGSLALDAAMVLYLIVRHRSPATRI